MDEYPEPKATDSRPSSTEEYQERTEIQERIEREKLMDLIEDEELVSALQEGGVQTVSHWDSMTTWDESNVYNVFNLIPLNAYQLGELMQRLRGTTLSILLTTTDTNTLNSLDRRALLLSNRQDSERNRTA